MDRSCCFAVGQCASCQFLATAHTLHRVCEKGRRSTRRPNETRSISALTANVTTSLRLMARPRSVQQQALARGWGSTAAMVSCSLCAVAWRLCNFCAVCQTCPEGVCARRCRTEDKWGISVQASCWCRGNLIDISSTEQLSSASR
jgi:hypothetical protein